MREELEEVRGKIHERIRIKPFYWPAALFLSNTSEFRQATSNIWLFAFHCQDPCWHGAIDRDVTFVFRQIIHEPPSLFESRQYLSPQNRCIDLVTEDLIVAANIRGTLLLRTLCRSRNENWCWIDLRHCSSKGTISLIKQYDSIRDLMMPDLFKRAVSLNMISLIRDS